VVQFKTIVLTTDLSPNADAAQPYAIELARKYDGTIFLLHVFEQDIYYASASSGEGLAANPVEWLVEFRKQRGQQLDKAAKALQQHGVRVVHQMREGQPAQEVIELAKKEKADCIVISTHGRSGISQLVFGSVAERVVRLSPCPVLTVRPTVS
jgi:universal stress protein A